MKKTGKASAIKQAIFWGIISLAAYFLVFTNQQAVMDYTTVGGSYGIIVIVVAFAFSFIHGTFANFLVEVMGFKAAKHGEGGH